MPDSGPIKWTPSAVLPKAPMSFADVGYKEMLSRARALKPVLAQRAEHSLKSERAVGACAVPVGPLSHRVGVGQLGDAGQVVGHSSGGGVRARAAWSGA